MIGICVNVDDPDHFFPIPQANMMKIGLVTPEITKLTNGPFWMRRQKLAYVTEYLTNNWTDLHQQSNIGRRMGNGDYKT